MSGHCSTPSCTYLLLELHRIAVNQRWVGHPGTRLSFTGHVNGNFANSSQTWVRVLVDTLFMYRRLALSAQFCPSECFPILGWCTEIST
jgi:hypothetical protein